MLTKLKDYQPDLLGSIVIIFIWAFSFTFVSHGVQVIFSMHSQEFVNSLGVIVGTLVFAYVFFWVRSIPLSRLFSPSFATPPVLSRDVLLLVFLISCCVFIISAFVVDMIKILEIGYFPDFIPLGRQIPLEQQPANLLSSLIAASLCEEIIFTGIVLRGLLHHRSPLYAIVASSVLFGIMHILTDNALYATLGAISTGWLYWRTRSLWPAILAHSTNNLLSITTGYVSSSVPQVFFYALLLLSILSLPVLIHRVHVLTKRSD